MWRILALLALLVFQSACDEAYASRIRTRTRTRGSPPPIPGGAEAVSNVFDEAFNGDWEAIFCGDDFNGTTWTEVGGTSRTLSILNGSPVANSTTTGLPASDALGAGRTNKAVYFPSGARIGNNTMSTAAIPDGEGMHIRILVWFTSIANGRFLFFWQPNATSRVYIQASTADRLSFNYQASSAILYTRASPSNFFSNTQEWMLADFTMIDDDDTTPYGEMYNNGTKTTLSDGTINYGEFETDGSAFFRFGDNTLGQDLYIMCIGVRGNSPALTEAQHDADCAALGLNCS